MEKEGLGHIVYSKNVIEFVTVANEYCRLVENISELRITDALERCQKILPLLYLKTTLLPNVEKTLDEDVEKFVTEMDYNIYLRKWEMLLGEDDSFPEVFVPGIESNEEESVANISESLLDIYQSVKDFITSYSLGDELVMNDALSNCLLDFKNYWGQRLVNVLRAIHNLLVSGKDLEEDQDISSSLENSGNESDWVDGFFQQFREENLK